MKNFEKWRNNLPLEFFVKYFATSKAPDPCGVGPAYKACKYPEIVSCEENFLTWANRSDWRK